MFVQRNAYAIQLRKQQISQIDLSRKRPMHEIYGCSLTASAPHKGIHYSLRQLVSILVFILNGCVPAVRKFLVT